MLFVMVKNKKHRILLAKVTLQIAYTCFLYVGYLLHIKLLAKSIRLQFLSATLED